jgi:hypothetical protein
MNKPGAILYRFAANVSEPMTRALDAWLADFWFEYAAADRWWKCAWIRFAYTAAWVKTITQVGLHAEGASRALAYQFGGIAIVTLFLLPFELDAVSRGRPLLAFLLIPSVLVTTLSLGSSVGVLLSLGRRGTAAGRAAILVAACVYSLIAGAVMQWVLPEANQAFRVAYAKRPLLRGHGEMSLTELAAEVKRVPWPEYQNIARRDLHGRLVLMAAPNTLTVFLVSLAGTRYPRAVGGVTIFIYHASLDFGRQIVRPPDSEAWMLTVVWGPTLLLLGLTCAFRRGQSRKRQTVAAHSG